ncbi:MAG: PKD domain-containing protein, partial [Candidatus Poseidoniia archaeon]
ATDAADGAVDGKVVTGVISGGEGLSSFVWKVDGIVVSEAGLILSLSELEVGVHNVVLTATDEGGNTNSSEVIFTSFEVNIAPTISLTVDSNAYAMFPVNWSIAIADENGDPLTTSVDFGDGSVGSTEENGTHSWQSEGTFTLTATVTDDEGEATTTTNEIVISDNLPPTLSVLLTPQADGKTIITLEEQINLSIQSSDFESQILYQLVEWGDGSEELTSDVLVSHTYTDAGVYTVSVEVADHHQHTTSWQQSIEVVEEVADTAAYQYYLDNLPEDDAVEQELDSDSDGTVDEAAEAENESGYDWESDFDDNGDGEADHDDGNIGNWQTKDDNQVQSVAESNDTSGGGRSAREGDDPLTDMEGHVDDNETSTEIPDKNMSDEGEIIEDLFPGVEDEMNETEGEQAYEAEHYEELINGTHAMWWNESFSEDIDGDGLEETTCFRATAIMWRDADNDSNPERVIIYRVKYCTADRDGDGANDFTMYEIEALNATDLNDNGTPEMIEALHLISVTWINGTVVDSNTFLVGMAGVDLNEDGNPEKAAIAVAVIRQVDLTGDGSFESESIVYAVIAIEDLNDDGTPEKAIAVIHTKIKLDPEGDGFVNTEIQWTQVVFAKDRNNDGIIDDFQAAQFGETKFDNNSDGVVDTKTAGWLGLRVEDRNFDGQEDKVSMAQGWENNVDDNSDGIPESQTKWFAASVIKDIDADGNAEHIWYLLHAVESTDSDGDGNWDWENATAAGAEVRDWNSDGNIDYYAGVRIFSQKTAEHSNGWGSEIVAVWIVQFWDINSNGHFNIIHAVNLVTVHWDNNSDGNWNTEWGSGNVWHGIDYQGDGNYEREIYVGYEKAVSDDDADGNIEYSVEKITVHSRNSSLTGNLEHEYYFHLVLTKGNISTAGIAQYENTTLVAYETWNNTNRQETQAVVLVVDSWDYDRDGTKEAETVHVHHDNRN